MEKHRSESLIYTLRPARRLWSHSLNILSNSCSLFKHQIREPVGRQLLGDSSKSSHRRTSVLETSCHLGMVAVGADKILHFILAAMIALAVGGLAESSLFALAAGSGWISSWKSIPQTRMCITAILRGSRVPTRTFSQVVRP